MLDRETLLRAEEELNETEETREAAVQALTTWVTNQDKIPNFTDSRWLLSFLRVSKYSQEEAQSRLSIYWKSRRSGIMKTMNHIDPASPSVLNILRGPNFVYIPLPGCDKEGRQLILAKWNLLDTSGQSYSFEEWFRAVNLLFDTLCFLDENVMVNGTTFIMDAADISLRHLTFFGFHYSLQQFDVMQRGYPIRIKGVHYFNNNAIVSLLFSIVKKVMSTKLANRVHFHGYNMAPLYEYVDPSTLPEEYIPEGYTGPRAGSCEEIMEKFIQEKVLDTNNLQTLRKLYKCDPGGIERHEEGLDENLEIGLKELKLKDIDATGLIEN